jgi:hypothetical protein
LAFPLHSFLKSAHTILFCYMLIYLSMSCVGGMRDK